MTTLLRKSYGAKMQQARAIAAQFPDGNMPQEKANEISAILGEADVIKAQIELADRLEKGEQYAAEPGASISAATWRNAAPGEGDVAYDAKSWREMEVKGHKIRYFMPEAVLQKGYAGAFENYLRKGVHDLGPQDRKTLSEGVDAAGGFLVPEDYHTELIKKIATNAVIRGMARVVQTSRDMAKWPRVVYATDDQYTSGVRLTWTGETPATSTTHRVTDPVFGSINIPVHTAMASMPLTNVLLEDAAFDVAGVSSDLLAEAFALGEDNVFLNGTGISQPMGLLTQITTSGADSTAPSYVISNSTTAITTSGDASSAVRMLNLHYALPAQYRNNAAYVMNSATLKEVENLVDAQKRPLITSLIAGSLGADGEPTAIKARPVRVDEFVPDIGSGKYPIIFGDFSGYIVLDRVGFSIQRASELYIETDITLLVARKRVGGYCTEPWRFKVMKCGTS
jgi:HK97 family phage major capsid protein